MSSIADTARSKPLPADWIRAAQVTAQLQGITRHLKWPDVHEIYLLGRGISPDKKIVTGRVMIAWLN